MQPIRLSRVVVVVAIKGLILLSIFRRPDFCIVRYIYIHVRVDLSYIEDGDVNKRPVHNKMAEWAPIMIMVASCS